MKILRDLKELAINAATDTNTDDDRAILQKNFDQSLYSINDIATTTNYNGKNLLNGTISTVVQDATTATQTKTVYSTVETTTTVTETREVQTTTTVESTTTITTTDPITINNGDSITADGIYQLASDFTGTLNVAAQNVKIMGSGSTLSNAQINVTASNANLWIENLQINNSSNINAIKFGSGTNTLIAVGNNNFTTANVPAAINIGGGLNIIGTGTITASGGRGAAIGTDASETSTADINIGGSVKINATSMGGAGIGSGYQGSVGNITIGNTATVNATSSLGARIGAGYRGNVRGTIATGVENLVTGLTSSTELTEPGIETVTETREVETTTTVTETVEVPTTTTVAEIVTETVEIAATFASNFVFHTGDKAGQSMSFSIGDMHTSSLRGKVPSEADNERLVNLQNDADKYRTFQELLDEVQNLTLDDINLRTRENANIAIRVIDGALDYALDQATNIGAYLQRLEYTLENVTTAAENTQAAESTIRDADMAREFSEYTKANVLSQAAQAVIAQANQNGGRVLSLLQ